MLYSKKMYNSIIKELKQTKYIFNIISEVIIFEFPACQIRINVNFIIHLNPIEMGSWALIIYLNQINQSILVNLCFIYIISIQRCRKMELIFLVS